MLNQLDFKSKNIFIGGSSNGIGWESAKLFSDFGGNVTLVSRNNKILRQRISELTNNGTQNHNYIVLDFSTPNELELKLKEFVKKNSINYDVIINNTGGPPSGELENATAEDLLQAFNLHLISFHKILGVLLEGIKNKGGGGK